MRSVSLCVAAACLAGGAARAEERPEVRRPVRTYTNADLERVSPYRDQTGALSQPGMPAEDEAAPAASRGSQGERGGGEARWRREAERVRRRVASLQRRAEALRLRIEQVRSRPPGRSDAARRGAAEGAERLELSLRGVLQQIREAQDELEERARRAGALPGWLR